MTALPGEFNSQYSVSVSNDNQSSTTTTNSYSYASSETLEEKVQFDVPVISLLDGTFKQTWESKAEATSSEFSSYTGSASFNAATTTGFDDVIWFNTIDFNIYYYPVIGQTVTVTDTDDSVSEQQLYVTFSGPSNTNDSTIKPAQGSSVEWFQPVHEPGQIFSYPWNLTQLEASYGGIDLLTPTTAEPFYTDNSSTTEQLSWTAGSSDGDTVGSTQTHSFDTDNSVSAGSIGDEGFGLEFGSAYNYNSSTSAESLYQSTTSLGSSTGIEISKPGFENGTFYSYLVVPYIFGQSTAVETAQEISLDTDIKTKGPLTTAYIADPTDSDAGAWWTADVSPYIQHIDVALNHPARWKVTYNFGASASDPSCISYYCATSYSPESDDLWVSPFYYMRGLLVTVDGASGPQRTAATVGDEVYLTARVYNYSLKDMPSDSQIHARFYRQKLNGTTPDGDSELIEEVTTEPLPAFNSETAPDSANWKMVQTSFIATDDMADTNYFFWVTVWVEDASGALVDEVPGHGLTELPGTLTAVGDVPIETVSITTTEGSVESTSFSNNVGLFKQKFYISPAPSSDLLGDDSPADNADEGTLSIESIEVISAPELGQGVQVATVKIGASDGDVSGISVLFYDDDPASESAGVYDIEYLPYVRSGETNEVRIPFVPATCGVLALATVANSGSDNRTQDSTIIEIPCTSTPVYFPLIARP